MSGVQKLLCLISIFIGCGPDEVTGEWRKLHNEELKDLYSPNTVLVMKSRIMRWAGHVALMGERRGVYRTLVGKPDGDLRPRLRWQDNGIGIMDWTDIALRTDRWRAFVNAVMNLRVP
jgi:hypothetical protein